MWNVENVNKEMFAAFSTIELGCELVFGLPLIIVGISYLIAGWRNK